MVRLCVVAPTVNVHFNQQQTSCKAPMPSNRIKSIIQNEVLPNFTSLFLQMEEGVAQNGSRLDKWLEEMLAEMQTSIQAHLHDVFSGDSGNINGTTSNTPSRLVSYSRLQVVAVLLTHRYVFGFYNMVLIIKIVIYV